MRVTSQQRIIAEVCRVSPATVSLALNHHPRVAERTRLRIQTEARRLGYVPNYAARQLAQGRFGRHRHSINRVGFVLFAPHTPLRGAYMAILAGVEQEVSAKGGTLLFVRETPDRRPRARFVELSRSGAVDGLALVGDVDDTILRKAKRTGLPFVVMGDHRGSMPVHQVTADFPAMGRLAVQHLADRGHRRIAFIGATMSFVYQREIRAGFHSALEELGVPGGASLIQWHGAGQNLTTPLRRVLALQPRPTALVMGEPKEVSHLLALLKGYGLAVPGDISLVACEESDSLPVAEGVTYVDVSMAETGAAGAALLREVAAEPGCPVRRVLVPPRLIEGGSVRALQETRT